MRHHPHTLALIVCALALHPSPLRAQARAEASPEQDALIRKGVQASNEGQPEEALRFYRAALALGESNVLQLNIGRAYQKMGDCGQAEARYKRALEAPQVEQPSPSEVQEAVARYLAQMPEGCLASLLVECPPEAELRLDRAPLACQQLVTRAPGVYQLLGRWQGRKVARQIELKPREALRINDLFAEAAPAAAPPVAEEGGGAAQVVGWSLLGGGALLLGGGAWMALEVASVNDQIAQIPRGQGDPARGDALIAQGERAQTLELLGLGLGAAALAGGALLLWLGEDDPAQEGAALRPLWRGDALGATLEARW